MNHIETLKGMRETCINREADALKTANVLAQKTLPGYETSKETIDNAFETAERYAARAKALTYAIAVVEAALPMQDNAAPDNIHDQSFYRVDADVMEALFDALEGKEAKPDA